MSLALRSLGLGAAFAALLFGAADAQQQRATTLVTGSTISVTNTYQALLAADSARKGCLFQNQGTHTMFIFPGTVAAANTAGVAAGSGAMQIAANGTFNCGMGNMLVSDQLVVTGTSGDGFVIWNQ
jgi:hypothetical protein